DVYALGVLLCEALGGTVPGPAERAAKALRRRNPRVSAGLADLLSRCLASDPAARYHCAGELATDLRRHLADLPLRGVRNRSLVETWRKWRRRRPYALQVLPVRLAVALAGGGLAIHAARQREAAEAVRDQGEINVRQRRYAEALEAFRLSAALVDGVPFSAGLRQQVEQGAQR